MLNRQPLTMRSRLTARRFLPVVLTAALLTLSAGSSAPAIAAPPSFCSSENTDHRPIPGLGPVGTILVTTSSADDAVTVDGFAIGKGPVLLQLVSVGKHRVAIVPVNGAGLAQEIDVVAQEVHVVGPPDTGLARPLAPALSDAVLGDFTEHGNWTADVQPKASMPTDARRLATLRCDPTLTRLLPTPASVIGPSEAACQRGDGEACRVAGERWTQRIDDRFPDSVKAAARFKRGCALGNVGACVELARCLEHGEGLRRDVAASKALRHRLCAEGDGDTCALLGMRLLPLNPTTKDDNLALPWLTKACELRSFYGCHNARQAQLRLSCARGDGGACELLHPK